MIVIANYRTASESLCYYLANQNNKKFIGEQFNLHMWHRFKEKEIPVDNTPAAEQCYRAKFQEFVKLEKTTVVKLIPDQIYRSSVAGLINRYLLSTDREIYFLYRSDFNAQLKSMYIANKMYSDTGDLTMMYERTDTIEFDQDLYIHIRDWLWDNYLIQSRMYRDLRGKPNVTLLSTDLVPGDKHHYHVKIDQNFPILDLAKYDVVSLFK